MLCDVPFMYLRNNAFNSFYLPKGKYIYMGVYVLLCHMFKFIFFSIKWKIYILCRDISFQYLKCFKTVRKCVWFIGVCILISNYLLEFDIKKRIRDYFLYFVSSIDFVGNKLFVLETRNTCFECVLF